MAGHPLVAHLLNVLLRIDLLQPCSRHKRSGTDSDSPLCCLTELRPLRALTFTSLNLSWWFSEKSVSLPTRLVKHEEVGRTQGRGGDDGAGMACRCWPAKVHRSRAHLFTGIDTSSAT